ncbi:hypothetical protein LCGC14_2392120 [marine sediment metagenome]|uniref:Uncharacterized protein n=1 Tax=marine sediment metagenome TaxID=412755 RepID=A0A0F9ESF6_9ZZZZ
MFEMQQMDQYKTYEIDQFHQVPKNYQLEKS